jgi:outer membrane protein OmpA-like peptidoglycan-associated protein
MKQCLFCLLVVGFSFLSHAQQFAPRYELIKLGKQVNSFYHEAAPVISPDGKDLYFFVSNHPENTYGKDNSQDIWVTHKDDKGNWSEAKRLGPPLNQHQANQVFTVLPDGSIFIRGGRGKNDTKSFSLVSPQGGWNEINVDEFDKMCKGRFYGAALSADARHMVLYFSEVDKSIKSDLYISHAQGGRWTRPEKLACSTTADEFGVFIGPDNKSIYFASDRNVPGRQGSSDIYKIERLDETWTKFSEPVNIGRPINTAAGDAYFTVDNNGNVFTSRANSRVDGGNLDLYMMVPRNVKVMINGLVVNEKTSQPIPANVAITVRDVKPIAIKTPANGKFETRIPETDQYVLAAAADGFLPREYTFSLPKLGGDTTITHQLALTPISKKLVLAGMTYNRKTGNPLSARLEITAQRDKSVNYRLQSAANGAFQQEIGKLGWYLFTASAEGFLNAVDSVEVANEEQTPVSKDLYLQPLEVGVTVRLKNIFFDFDRTTLKSESYTELNKVVDFLRQNSTVEIEIAGHTDSKGSDEYNRNLSQGRSQSVVNYLVSQGIEEFRLTAKGYGESKPIDTNETDEGRANNRRVEFTILKM